MSIRKIIMRKTLKCYECADINSNSSSSCSPTRCFACDNCKNLAWQIVFVQHYEDPGARHPGGSGNSLHDYLSSTYPGVSYYQIFCHKYTRGRGGTYENTPSLSFSLKKQSKLYRHRQEKPERLDYANYTQQETIINLWKRLIWKEVRTCIGMKQRKTLEYL